MIYYNYYQASSQQDSDKTRYEFKELNPFPLNQELMEITHALNSFFEDNDYGDLTIDLYSETFPVVFSSFQAYLDNHDLLTEKSLNWTPEQSENYLLLSDIRNTLNKELLSHVVDDLNQYAHAVTLNLPQKKFKL